MPSTRSQTAHNTRSSGPASTPTGPGTSTGVKRRQTKAKSKASGQTKAKSKKSSIPKPSARRSDPNNKEKIRRILWNLVKKYFPWLKIILKPLKSHNNSVVFIIIAAILMSYAFWSFRITIINVVTVFWEKRFPADLSSVYFNDASHYHTQCQTVGMHRKTAEELKDQGGKNIIFIRGSASRSARSSYANQLGVCLFESLKQIKQDNQPVDVITINVSSESSRVMRSIYDAILAVCGSSQKADCKKKIKEDFDFNRDLFPSESNISKLR